MVKKYSCVQYIWILAIVVILLLVCQITTKPLIAQEGLANPSEASENLAGKKPPTPFPEPKLSVTHHSIQIDAKRLNYTATAGYIQLKDDIGKTSYFAAKYTMNHLRLDPSLWNNIILAYYDGGHQMYTHLPSLKKLKTDASAFVRRTLESGQ